MVRFASSLSAVRPMPSPWLKLKMALVKSAPMRRKPAGKVIGNGKRIDARISKVAGAELRRAAMNSVNVEMLSFAFDFIWSPDSIPAVPILVEWQDAHRSLLASHEPRPDPDLGRERFVDGTLVRDLEEPRPLLLRQRSLELDVAIDAIEHPVLVLAVFAIRGVDLRVAQPHSDTLERPLLASGVERHCHRRARAEGGDQEVVGARPRVGPSRCHRFVRE